MSKVPTILIVDDEWQSAIVVALRRRLEREGWKAVVVRPEAKYATADEFEVAALYALEEERPRWLVGHRHG